MGLNFNHIPGKAPGEKQESDDFLLPGINNRVTERLELEQQNIEEAIQWTLSRNFRKEEVFSMSFIRNLHKKMYGKVWSGAGEFWGGRKKNTEELAKLEMDIQLLLDEALLWIRNNTYPPDEIALRFKHRLLNLQVFYNGSNRHSRLMADTIINRVFNKPVFTWGAKLTESRKAYFHAINLADNGNYSRLLAFARS